MVSVDSDQSPKCQIEGNTLIISGKGVVTQELIRNVITDDIDTVIINEGISKICNQAFYSCYSIISIKIPKSVTSIGNIAFMQCSSLNEIYVDEKNKNYCSIDGVLFDHSKRTIISYPPKKSESKYTIPESVTSIGDQAFVECTLLTSIDIPRSVTSIKGMAFEGCTALTSIDIPESVTSIGYCAFEGCTALTSVVIPKSVTLIAKWAFEGCTSLVSVLIPTNVGYIGEQAFARCYSLNEIYVDEKNKNYCSIDGVLFDHSKRTIISYPPKKSESKYTIPKGVTSIGDQAFGGCSSLTSVVIPKSVTSIGDQAFVECTSLASIDIPESVTSIGYCAFEGCTALTSIVIPEGVTSISDQAFEGCSSLTSVVIPKSVTSIGDQAFEGCTSLASINIPESVTSIGEWVFGGCTALTSIVIPKNITSIEYVAFEGCTSLTLITIPENVTSIGDCAFGGCSSLNEIYVDRKNKNYCSIDGVLFDHSKRTIISYPPKKSESKYTIPESVTSIGKWAFEGCTSLTLIDLPDNITFIEDQAFKGCNSLTSVVIPKNVTSIGEQVFEGCNSLNEIYVDEKNKNYCSIDGILFDHSKRTIISYPPKKSESKYTIPESVTSIGKWAFKNCTSLTSIVIPDSVTSIGYCAFEGCVSLEKNPIHIGITHVGFNIFKGVPKIAALYTLSKIIKTSKNCPPNELCRYRKIEKAWSEIKKQYLYFSSPLKNNDPFDSWYSLKSLDIQINETFYDEEYGVIRNKSEYRELKIKEAKEQARKLLNSIGICCFSERNNNLQLWALYADDHKGICIGYNPEKFKNVNKSLKVNYCEKMKTDPYKHSLEPDETEIVNAWFNKSTEYSSEQEWRIVDDQGRKDVQGAISTIYIGENIQQLDRESCYKLEDIISFCINNRIKICYMDKDYYEYKLIPKTIYSPYYEKIDNEAREHVSSVIKDNIGVEIKWDQKVI